MIKYQILVFLISLFLDPWGVKNQTRWLFVQDFSGKLDITLVFIDPKQDYSKQMFSRKCSYQPRVKFFDFISIGIYKSLV